MSTENNGSLAAGPAERAGKESEEPVAIGTAPVEFKPIFICGCQRSGTTALAVMFDRHSGIAVPRETQFFNVFAPVDRRKRLPRSHEDLLARAMENYYISRVGVTYEEVLPLFRERDATYANMLRAILLAYGRQQGKRRVAEKSCGHLHHVPELLEAYPKSRIICILRDGRDVVRSLQRVPWAQSAPLPRLCYTWIRAARCGQRWERELPLDRFTVVRYEDLMTNPQGELERLCQFVGEQFEPAQLAESTSAGPVQECEAEWKAKAKTAPDPQRVAAWRRSDDHEAIARMVCHMGSTLRACGYPDAQPPDVPLVKRLRWEFEYLPYCRPVFPIARHALKIGRLTRSLLGGGSRS